MADDAVASVRPAGVDDAEAVARVHVETWQAAYDGVLPADYLATLDWRGRVASTRTWIAEPKADVATLVVTRGEVIGFSTFGPVRDDDLSKDTCGEIYAIYVRAAAWSTGAGSALLRASLQTLSTYDQVALWVLEANSRARHFYECHGFRPDGASKRIEIGGADLPEIRYRWTP